MNDSCHWGDPPCIKVWGRTQKKKTIRDQSGRVSRFIPSLYDATSQRADSISFYYYLFLYLFIHSRATPKGTLTPKYSVFTTLSEMTRIPHLPGIVEAQPTHIASFLFLCKWARPSPAEELITWGQLLLNPSFK